MISLLGLLLTFAPGSSLTAPAEVVKADKPLTQKIAVADALTIKVGDREKATDELIAAAEAAGGYFTARGDNYIALRIPTAKESEVLAKAQTLGLVVQRAHHADDLTSYLEEQRTLLASRRDVLERYFEVLQTARTQAVTTVERQMTMLITQIEELQGALVLAEHRLSYADLQVSFEFRDRSVPSNDGSSSFQWLNTMNLADLIGDFQYGTR